MAKLGHLTAVILAGGLGTRLRSVVADQPKVLAPVSGRPFLSRLLDQVQEAGLRQAVLCTGYLGEMIQDTFGSRYRDVELIYSEEKTPLGTGGALRLAAENLPTADLLVMNGDSYFQSDWEDFWRRHAALGVVASLLLTCVPDVKRFGQVLVDERGFVRRFQEKGAPAGEGWINAGIYLTTREALLSIPKGRPVSLERDVFPDWIHNGMGGIRQPGRFIDIGTPESYAAAQEFFRRQEQA